MITKLHFLPLLLLWVACLLQITAANNVQCDGETLNMCEQDLMSWKVSVMDRENLYLEGCTEDQLPLGSKLFLFVSKAPLSDYGKYKIVIVRKVTNWSSGCKVKLGQKQMKSISKPISIDENTLLIAQKFPSFGQVSLRNGCVLTCDEHNNGVGGILAFGAESLLIDETSKIDMSGKGYAGGKGGNKDGGGGYGGDTFAMLQPTMGKGGDVYNVANSSNHDGIGGGGAADGPGHETGYKGGPGDINAGGGGADSTADNDDGAAGGGGGGHFSGGGGGGGGSGCRGQDGGKGGAAGSMGAYAGGGGRSSCPGNNGGNGGEAGGATGLCFDNTATGGNAGSDSNGGGGGDSCGGNFGGGGGGGGLQFGNSDYKSRLSYGGGGGGGGGSAFTDDQNPGGRGGNGGGLVYLELGELTLEGNIDASGEPGQCLNQKAYRSAPGGSGAGGSVVIITNTLVGVPGAKISVSGGDPVKCAFGAGGGGGGGVGRWVVQEKKTIHQR